MCLTSQINKLKNDLSIQKEYIKYLYTVIEKHEGEIEELKNKNSELQRKLRTAIEDNSFKEECLVAMEQRIDVLENENIQLKNRILEYSSQLIKPKKKMAGTDHIEDYYRNSDSDSLLGVIREYTNRYHNIIDSLVRLVRINNNHFTLPDDVENYRTRIYVCAGLLLERMEIEEERANSSIVANERDLLALQVGELRTTLLATEIERDQLILDLDNLNKEKNTIVEVTIRNIIADYLSNIGEQIETPIDNPIETLKFYFTRLEKAEKDVQIFSVELDNCRADGRRLRRRSEDLRKLSGELAQKIQWSKERNNILL